MNDLSKAMQERLEHWRKNGSTPVNKRNYQGIVEQDEADEDKLDRKEREAWQRQVETDPRLNRR